MALYTAGYEGLSIGQFIARLKAAGVDAVFDVRQLPLSRKKGFSKTAFSEALREADIAYFHMPIFGCPRPIRDQYKGDGNWQRYETAFNAYLSEQAEAVAKLANVAKKTTGCLVCFEADYNYCHRNLVANAVMGVGGPKAIHLGAKTASPGLVRAAA